VFGGLGALLLQFGLLKGVALWQLWPIALAWGGFLKLIGASYRGSRFWGLLMIAAGAIVEAHYFGILPWHWSAIWPLLVILLGVRVLTRSLFGRPPVPFACQAGEAGPALDLQVTLGGRQDNFDGRPFSGGTVRCTLGGYELDLRGAEMVGDEAIIEFDVTMGGVELRVPRTWRVEVDSSPVMAAVENHTTCSDPSVAKRLIVRGRVVMGGVEIRN